MRVLQVCKKFPFPVMDGEGVAVRALARGLVEAGCAVDLLSFNTTKHRVADPQDVDLPHYDSISSCDLDNTVTWIDAGASILRRGSYHVNRFDSDAFREQLRTLLGLRRYDVVVLETTILALYIPTVRTYSDALVALRAHNLEFEIWARIARRSHWALRPVYHVLARRLRRFEERWVGRCDLLLPITARDAESFASELRYRGPVHVVPVGYDAEASSGTPTRLADLPQAMSFIGSLDWAPNVEGLRWFLGEVWPLLAERFPRLELHVAGRKTPDDLHRLALERVFVHGEVADSGTFLERYPMTVAPILSGSGTRVKILDALDAGRVVLTTPEGLEGIDAVDRREVLICPTPTAFVEQVGYVLAHPSELARIGECGRGFIRDHFDYARIGLRLAAALQVRRRALGKVPVPT